MRKLRILGSICAGVFAINAISVVPVFADGARSNHPQSPAPTSSSMPSPIISASPSPSPAAVKKPRLTVDQSVALAAAQAAYATAVANARNGFSRAIADAKSVLDQSMAAAGKDKAAIALAKQTYKDSYSQIFQALTAGLDAAKSAFESAKLAILATK